MTIKDIGPKPQSFDLEQATRENENYWTVAWSGRYLQVALMSIPVGGDIGLEAHPQTDQFLRLDAGRGRFQMGTSEDQLTFEGEVSDGWCMLIPAGTWHNVTNIGEEPLQVYAIYAPAHHKPGKVHRTASDAAADTDDEAADGRSNPMSRRQTGTREHRDPIEEHAMIIDLSGETAVVTGSTGGIGRAIATGLARSGCSALRCPA